MEIYKSRISCALHTTANDMRECLEDNIILGSVYLFLSPLVLGDRFFNCRYSEKEMGYYWNPSLKENRDI